MRSRAFQMIAFDWDGTLADSTSLIADSLQRACRDLELPVPSDEDARFVIGLGLVDALRHVAPGLAQERYPDLAGRYRLHYIGRDERIELYAGVRELLAELDDAGYLMCVATGKSRAGLERALAQQSIAHHFVATRCADEGFPKPHPDMLLHLMGVTGVDPQQTIMIGDTTHDLELAQNAGAAAIGVAYGAHAPEEFARLKPLATVRSVAELRAWLQANG